MIYTRRLPNLNASLQLGGITLYGNTESEISETISDASMSIENKLHQHIMLTMRGIRQGIIDTIVAEKPERVFSAIFGRLLSTGKIKVFLCQSYLHARYRAYVHSERTTRLETALTSCLRLLNKQTASSVSQVEEELFGSRAWGTWSISAMLIDRLAAIGFIEHIGKFEFTESDGLKYARTARECAYINLGTRWLEGSILRAEER